MLLGDPEEDNNAVPEGIEDNVERDGGACESPTRPLGYEAKFVHSLLKGYECPICLFAMRNPVQTECGHRFCRGCLETVLEKMRPLCPLDRGEISLHGVRKTSHVQPS